MWSVKNTFVLSLLTILTAVFINFWFYSSVYDLCEIDSCPYCYGTNLCQHFTNNSVKLSYDTFTKVFFNTLSVKNVYFARFNNSDVVLKKLGHSFELNSLNIHTDETIFKSNSEHLKNFVICDNKTAFKFHNLLQNEYNFTQQEMQTLLQINAEPLLLSIFQNVSVPFPKYYGACGRLIMVENCGNDLNSIQHLSWYKRAFVGVQILEGAFNLTFGHENFRLYLTDLSPDNISVNENLEIAFIDLENAILSGKKSDKSVHNSAYFDDDYAFFPQDICKSSISDHNIFSVCKLILSERAPWPMMVGGLLSAPEKEPKIEELFRNIEACVNENNRFETGEKILQILKSLSLHEHF